MLKGRREPAETHRRKTTKRGAPFRFERPSRRSKRRAETLTGQAIEEEQGSAPGLVELRGIEPLTSAVRLQRSPI